MSFNDELAQFMAAIRKVESGGNYQAIGADQGSRYGVARGAYQVMSALWSGWAKEAGYAGADWRDPKAQDAVAAHKMSYYYRKYGDWRLVAAAWFGGEGAANKMAKGGDLSRTNDGFINVPTYVQRVVNAMGGTKGATSADRAMLNTAVAASPDPEALNPFEAANEMQGPDEWRQQAVRLLDAMSTKISSNPERFAALYGGRPLDGEEDEEVEPTWPASQDEEAV